MNASATPFPRRRDWLLLAAGLAFLYLCLLGTRGLNEPDEGRYANIAFAMTQPGGGGWWEPRLSGYGHYDKPPGIYWATALGLRAFGPNDWAARLPSLAGAWMALLGLGWAAYRLRGANVAWWAVLICGTLVQFWVLGRILSPDMFLTGWCTLAVAAWAEGRHRGGGWGWWGVSLLCWVGAWWVKATAGLVPLAGLAAGVWLTRDAPGRRALRPFLLLPAILLLGAPWYLSLLHRYPELRGFFFGRELAGRLAGRVDGRHGNVLYYLPICLLGWLPWWPLAAWKLWRERRGPPAPAEGAARAPWRVRPGVEGWMVLVGVAIFSCVGSKLPTYILTLTPWAALSMARAVVGTREPAEAGGGFPTWRLLPAVGFAAVALACTALLPPRCESHLGVNSSLQDVYRLLRQRGATRVDLDHYWPSAEFSLGAQTVHYLYDLDGPPPGTVPATAQGEPAAIERLHERETDPGVLPHRFVNSEDWPTLPPDGVTAQTGRPGGWWFVRFHVRPKPKFDGLLADPDPARRPVKVARFGDFDVYHMPDPPKG